MQNMTSNLARQQSRRRSPQTAERATNIEALIFIALLPHSHMGNVQRFNNVHVIGGADLFEAK
jgi:hypothetical protein